MQVFESNIEIKRWRNYFENINIIFKDIVEKLKKTQYSDWIYAGGKAKY